MASRDWVNHKACRLSYHQKPNSLKRMVMKCFVAHVIAASVKPCIVTVLNILYKHSPRPIFHVPLTSS